MNLAFVKAKCDRCLRLFSPAAANKFFLCVLQVVKQEMTIPALRLWLVIVSMGEGK